MSNLAANLLTAEKKLFKLVIARVIGYHDLLLFCSPIGVFYISQHQYILLFVFWLFKLCWKKNLCCNYINLKSGYNICAMVVGPWIYGQNCFMVLLKQLDSDRHVGGSSFLSCRLTVDHPEKNNRAIGKSCAAVLLMAVATIFWTISQHDLLYSFINNRKFKNNWCKTLRCGSTFVWLYIIYYYLSRSL